MVVLYRDRLLLYRDRLLLYRPLCCCEGGATAAHNDLGQVTLPCEWHLPWVPGSLFANDSALDTWTMDYVLDYGLYTDPSGGAYVAAKVTRSRRLGGAILLSY